METDEENKEEEDEIREKPLKNMKKKQRKMKEEDILLEGKTISGLEILVHEKEQMEEGSGEVVIKDRHMAQKNFNVRTLKMGIVREVMNH